MLQQGEFCYHARVGEDYFLSDMDDIFVRCLLNDRETASFVTMIKEIAALIDRLPLASRDRHTFCAAPVDVKNNFVLYYFVQVRAKSRGGRLLP